MHTRCWEDTKGQETSSAHVRVAGKCAEAVRGQRGSCSLTSRCVRVGCEAEKPGDGARSAR